MGQNAIRDFKDRNFTESNWDSVFEELKPDHPNWTAKEKEVFGKFKFYSFHSL